MLDPTGVASQALPCMLPHGSCSQDPCVDMHCTVACDDTGCYECDASLGCAADATLCFDPACTLPPCDQEDHVAKALSFGILPCSCVPDMCCPPAHDSMPIGLHPSDPALHSACTSACSNDPCALGVETHCQMPMPQGCDTSLAHPGACVSICDGFVAPTAISLNDPSALDMMYMSQLLDHCCTHCPPKNMSNALPAPPIPEAKTPAFRASDGSTSSETACSTPGSLVSPLSSPCVHNMALRGMFQCQWAECQVCVRTLEELAAHVQKDHFAQMTSPLMDKSCMPSVDPLEPVPAAAWMTPLAEPSWPALPAAPASAPCASESESRQLHRCGWIHCTESFDTHAELTAHITQVHVGSGKTEYECGWVGCERAQQGRKFSQKQKVLRHIQTHTGDRPFVCSECHKRFSEANTLAQHMRIHTNERPYKCDFPGCNKAFSVIGSLTIHRRTHTGDRPFKCPYPGCGKQFSESSNLNKHIRVHRGDKPFRCPDCARCFTRPDQMARHRKVHAKARAVAAPPASAPPPAAADAAPALVEVTHP